MHICWDIIYLWHMVVRVRISIFIIQLSVAGWRRSTFHDNQITASKFIKRTSSQLLFRISLIGQWSCIWSRWCAIFTPTLHYFVLVNGYPCFICNILSWNASGVSREAFRMEVNAKDYGFEPSDTPRTDRSVRELILNLISGIFTVEFFSCLKACDYKI